MNSAVRYSLIVLVLIAIAVAGYFFVPRTTSAVRSQAIPQQTVEPVTSMPQEQTPAVAAVMPKQIHQRIPEHVRGIYISGWSAGTKSSMTRLMALIDSTDVNTVVVDIKDATGRLSYMPLDPDLRASGVGTKRIPDLHALITSLHDKGIYVIGRVAVFQDPYYPTVHPEAAYKDTRTGDVWKDTKGISWLNAESPEVWSYVTAIARDAYAQGFDEINLDYVRFPSDGALAYIDKSTLTKSRADIIKDFFIQMDESIRTESHIPLSADIFGLTMSAMGDLGIGQVLENIAPHVDYVAPMVYPSHFADGSYGIADPAANPYKIIFTSMNDGEKKLTAINEDPQKLRPWLQDFDLGAVYTADMVRAQVTAAHDAGLDSWLMWDPANRYTKEAL